MREFTIGYFSNNSLSFADHPFIDYDSNLFRIGVRQFTWHNLIEMLQTNLFLRSHTVEQNKRMIEYFFVKHTKTPTDVAVDISIEKIPFLLDQNNRLQLIKDIYFPGDTIGDSGTVDSDASFVHKSVLDWLNVYQQQRIKHWLRQLGVVERTDLSFLLKTIIPNASSYITHENAIKTAKKLLLLFEKQLIGKAELHQLKKMKLLTIRGTLVSASECYLSERFKPVYPLEEYLKEQEDRFLSTDYLRNDPFDHSTIDITEWKRFFLLMGVHEEIYIVPFDQKMTLQTAARYGFRAEYLSRFSPNGRRLADGYSGLKTIAFLRHTQGTQTIALTYEAFRPFIKIFLDILGEEREETISISLRGISTHHCNHSTYCECTR